MPSPLNNDRSAPLAGIRIIDFGHYIAGPLTGMLLADQGAEVIKINRPGSIETANLTEAVYNRNKKRLELDFKQANDLATIRQLIQSADVVIENFRPGVMKRLGLGAEKMTKLNPQLVYLSLPGFSAKDKQRSDIRAFEGVIGAATGLYTDLQILPRMVNHPPTYTPIPLSSTYAAIHGAIAITLALYAREASGCGDIIEVPLAGAAMSAMAIINLQVKKQPNSYGIPPLTDAELAQLPKWREQIQKQGESALKSINLSLRGIGSPASGTYLSGDGRWLYIHASGHSRNTCQLLKVLELYDGLIADGMVDLPVYENVGLDNNIPDSAFWSRAWNTNVQQRMANAIAQKPAQHWEDCLTAVGVPSAVHRTAKEWLLADQTDTAALTVEVEDPDFGFVRQVGVQAWLSSTDDSYMQPNPVQDVTNINELLASIQKSQKPLAQTNQQRKPILKGIRVLDLSNVLAGPASARTLAEYGAEVIKIDPPVPNFGPKTACYLPIEVSPGKRSIILDLKKDDGKKIFHRLVETADVVVHNFRPGVADRLGIDYNSLKDIKPDLVYVNLTAFNGPKPGPWMERPGFDPLLQAASGIQLRYGGKNQTPVLHAWASCIDYITGYSATFGAALALLHRQRNGRTGGGNLVTTSLAQGAQLVQIPLLVATRKYQPGKEVHGQQAVGEHALYRIYQAQDGYLFLAGRTTEKERLKQVAGLSNIADEVCKDDTLCSRWLASKISQQPVDTWVFAFQKAGLGIHRLNTMFNIADTYLHQGTYEQLKSQWDDGRSISWLRITDHSVGSAVELAPPSYARFKYAPIRLLPPAPKQGAHTQEVLKELGYNDDQITDWLTQQVIKKELHQNYLPS